MMHTRVGRDVRGRSQELNMSQTTDTLSKDNIFEVLSSSRRRYVIYYLYSHEGTAELKDLATHIAAWESGEPLDAITDEETRRVYISLYQTHLPKLAEFDIVRYDSDARIAELTPKADQLSRYLDSEPAPTLPWPLYYAVLSVVSLFLLVGLWLQFPPFDSMNGTSVAFIIAIGVIGITVVHYLYTRQRGGKDLSSIESLIE